MNDFLTFARKRYSCRSFAKMPVDEDKITNIINAALCAPSACNKQPWKIWVLESPQAQEVLKRATSHHFNASLALVVGANHEICAHRKSDGYSWATIDASIAATQLMLAVHDQGLATTWIGEFDPIVLSQAYPEMGAYEIVGLFPLGYPALQASPSPKHTDRRPFEQSVCRL